MRSSDERVLGEFREPAELIRAVERLRGLGYPWLEVYTPYPVHGLDEALAARPSRLPLAVFAVGACACAGAYGLQWLVDAYLYPLDVGGRPPHFPLSFVPITFEMTVLGAAFTAFLGVLALGRLLTLWQPIFAVDHFRSATLDGFWIELPDGDRAAQDLRDCGATHITALVIRRDA
jgi:hypothetical protein